jgi:uncharacterized membrane-anchored protein YitT (DUF2179 family)
VRASIRASRLNIQLVVAICLISGLTVIALVALFTPAHAAVAQGISTVTHMWSATFGVNSLTDGPHVLCGSSSGPCP